MGKPVPGKTGRNITLNSVSVRDSFWTYYQELVANTVLPYQWDVLNDAVPGTEQSRAIMNFRIAAGRAEGEYHGFVFQDSDPAKWLETLAYSLASRPDAAAEERADGLIDLIGETQQPDGYLNTYYTIREPGNRFTNLAEAHELYSAGHLMEAAVAYYRSTGKRKFLEIMCRYADLIDATFGPEDGKLHGYCGHPEIELALVKLYETTGERRYLELSRYFVEERGREPYYYRLELEKRNGTHIFRDFDPSDRRYFQAHRPVKEQTSAEGHAVRVVYLYSAAADLARLTGDEELRAACERIWNNITSKRMYVTGGIGSTAAGEAFTCDYDLPGDTAYAETCASVGMVFFAYRMLLLHADRRYADVMELELYNGALSGISLDGRKYFYVNPLEVRPDFSACNPGLRHVKPVRRPWYACACCPPNIARTIASLGNYVYTAGQDRINVHLYIGGTAAFGSGDSEITIRQETSYPYDGCIRITVSSRKPHTVPLYLRIPGWCKRYAYRLNGKRIRTGKLENGYLKVRGPWTGNDTVELDLDMKVERITANSKIPYTAGKAAIKRGPLVYCLEEADNGPDLHDIYIGKDPGWSIERDPDFPAGTVVLSGDAFRTDAERWDDTVPYAPIDPPLKPVRIRAVPYALWCNRTPGEMRVWINRK